MKAMISTDPIEDRMNFAKYRVLPAMVPVIMGDFGKKQKPLFNGENTIPTDFYANKACIEEITSEFPNDSVVSEESSKIGRNRKGNEFEWVIDDIDGSTNYNNQVPFFAVSIALKKRGDLKGGIVYRPKTKDLYSAQKGKGAYLNNNPIRVSNERDLRDARISLVSESCFRKHNLSELMQTLQKQFRHEEGLRCTSLDFAYVANGVFDGVVKPTKNPWGVSAGILLVKEAGGKISYFKKDDVKVYVASNPYIHNSLCGVVKHYMEGEKQWDYMKE